MKRSLKLKRNHTQLNVSFYETLYLPYLKNSRGGVGEYIPSMPSPSARNTNNNSPTTTTTAAATTTSNNNQQQQQPATSQPHPSQPRHQSTCATTEAMLGSKSMARHPQWINLAAFHGLQDPTVPFREIHAVGKIRNGSLQDSMCVCIFFFFVCVCFFFLYVYVYIYIHGYIHTSVPK